MDLLSPRVFNVRWCNDTTYLQRPIVTSEVNLIKHLLNSSDRTLPFNHITFQHWPRVFFKVLKSVQWRLQWSMLAEIIYHCLELVYSVLAMTRPVLQRLENRPTVGKLVNTGSSCFWMRYTVPLRPNLSIIDTVMLWLVILYGITRSFDICTVFCYSSDDNVVTWCPMLTEVIQHSQLSRPQYFDDLA